MGTWTSQPANTRRVGADSGRAEAPSGHRNDEKVGGGEDRYPDTTLGQHLGDTGVYLTVAERGRGIRRSRWIVPIQRACFPAIGHCTRASPRCWPKVPGTTYSSIAEARGTPNHPLTARRIGLLHQAAPADLADVADDELVQIAGVARHQRGILHLEPWYLHWGRRTWRRRHHARK